MEKIEKIFTKIGGEFITPVFDITGKLSQIRAYLFDWDGVFNPGIKGEGTYSHFTEIDSMGTNLLRFGHWIKNNELPLFGIITGQTNKSAFQLSQREHCHFVYYHFLNKLEALKHIRNVYGIEPQQVAFIFDDVLDLSIAGQCGLRFMVRRSASPLLESYVKERELCDYITANTGSNHAVREVCELILGLLGTLSETLDKRIKFDSTYQQYLSERNSVDTAFYTYEDGVVEKKILDKTCV